MAPELAAVLAGDIGVLTGIYAVYNGPDPPRGGVAAGSLAISLRPLSTKSDIHDTNKNPAEAGVQLRLIEDLMNWLFFSARLAPLNEKKIHDIYGSLVSVSVNFTATPSLASFCSVRTTTPRHLIIALPSGLLISSEKLI